VHILNVNETYREWIRYYILFEASAEDNWQLLLAAENTHVLTTYERPQIGNF